MPIFPGGFWYKQHCLTITPYLSAQIRYRYEGEDWQYVDGDDYLLEKEQSIDGDYNRKDVSLFAYFFLWGDAPRGHQAYPLKDGQLVETRILSRSLSAPLWKIDFKEERGLVSSIVVETKSVNGSCIKEKSIDNLFHYKNGNAIYVINAPTKHGSLGVKLVDGVQNIRLETRNSSPLPCKNKIEDICIFTITKDSRVVHKETRSVCPEVEKLDRVLGEPVRLDIETTPLGFIEVTNTHQSFDADEDNIEQIPDECWDVYNVIPSIPIGFAPTAYDANSPGGMRINKFIGQYCSAKGSPRPEVDYQEGSCDKCESCPENTCPVTCGDRVCCYGNDGIAVKSIPLENYCD